MTDFDAELAETFSAVVSLLWNERESLELLQFKLVQEQLLLQAGETRWLAKADAEVSEAIRRMRMSEVLRAAEMERILVELGLPAEATLAQLAEVAPEPWGLVLTEHRVALRSLVTEVQAAGHNVRVLLNAGANAIRETLDVLTQSVSTYSASGAEVERDFGSLFLDEQA
ncbi:MAG TPA: flagellar export chaperone FlgN [Jatrophihabitans sp.]